jgi:hypothetical protein
VVHGQSREGEIERPHGKRILEALHAQIRLGQRLSRHCEHRFARVDPHEPCRFVPREHPQGRLTCAGAELQDRRRQDALRSTHRFFLQFVVTRDVAADH